MVVKSSICVFLHVLSLATIYNRLWFLVPKILLSVFIRLSFKVPRQARIIPTVATKLRVLTLELGVLRYVL
jgi:hypothetical protein